MASDSNLESSPAGELPDALNALVRWELSDGFITIVADGRRRIATRDEVLTARSRGLLASQLPNLRFAVKAIPVRIRMSGTDPRQVGVDLVARSGTGDIRLDFDQDYLIHRGTWFSVEPATRNACIDLLESLGLSHKRVATLRDHQRMLSIPVAQDLVIDEFAVGSDWIVDAPAAVAGLAADLFPYQATGVRFLGGLSELDVGAVLADEMGLGKTVQAIALLLQTARKGQSLVVAPAGLLSNWRNELEKFSPSLRVLVHTGARRTGVVSGLAGWDVVLTSYETLAGDLTFLEDVSWNIVVLDEAQLIKNPDARRARAVKSLTKRIGLAISGTPVENRLTDLWSICEFVVPSLLGTRAVFESRTDSAALPGRVAGALASPITLRRSVSEVARDLPPIREAAISLDLTGDQLRQYRSISASGTALSKLTAQRVFAAHAMEEMSLPDFISSPKVSHLIEMMREIFLREEKALVFASFQASLDRLAEVVRQYFADAYLDIVDGRSGSHVRQAQVDNFSAVVGRGVLFLNPKAAGVGLNITAANHVIHFNPEWNPAVTDQATARAYRRNQERRVMVHHLFYAATVEDRVRDLVEAKRALIEDVNAEIEHLGDPSEDDSEGI